MDDKTVIPDDGLMVPVDSPFCGTLCLEQDRERQSSRNAETCMLFCVIADTNTLTARPCEVAILAILVIRGPCSSRLTRLTFPKQQARRPGVCAE